MKREREILQVSFSYRGQPSFFPMETKVAQILEQRLGNQFSAWFQHQADAILAERTNISWLALHSKLKSQIAAALPNPELISFRTSSGSAPANIPQCLLKKSRL